MENGNGVSFRGVRQPLTARPRRTVGRPEDTPCRSLARRSPPCTPSSARTSWRRRDLRGAGLVYLYLDAIAVKVRWGGRVSSLPILVAVGITREGEKRLLALRLVGSESTAAWEALV
ncbi:MAG: transposase, partial [candidate division NC10 bacterium]|nr:transposase [candidate division NC10 bacterium]